MQSHRFFGEGQIIAPPRPSAPEFVPAGFVLCPVALRPSFPGAAGWASEVYRMAYEQARASARTSWYERVGRASLN
jgi:hypothetical protein